MPQKTRVAIITSGNPEDKKVWSGIPHFVYKALEQDFDEVVLLGPFKPQTLPLRLASSITYRLSKSFNSFARKIYRKRYNYDDSMISGRLYASFFEAQLAEKGPFDLIIAPASPTAICLLKTDVPIFSVGDATFKLLNGYYSYISDLLSFSQQESYATEKLALHNATCNIYSSQWAADSAVQDYDVPPGKTKVISFGANIDAAPRRQDVLRQGFSHKLLFLGVDWARKGGPIAFECLTALTAAGIDVQLIVCGCVPPPEFQHPNLRVIPFLDKNKPADFQEFVHLLRESDFLLLPTRADCTPVAFCEAAAYGIPSITTDTGGIGGVIDNGVNGFMLPFEARGDEYAALIAELYADLPRYLQLSVSTRDKYERDLNWAAWSTKVKELYQSL